MDPVLGDCTNVNPPLVINHNTNFNNDEKSLSSEDPDVTIVEIELPDTEKDPFIIRTGLPKGKKRQHTHDPNEGVATIMGALEKKWKSDKEVEEMVRVEEKETADKMMKLMEANVNIMSKAAEALTVIMQNM
jgi:hypothetical protein